MALKRLLLLSSVRHRMRSIRTLLRNAAAYDQPAAPCEPGGGEIIVLAPHMDDEALGCGGTVALHVRAGAQVTVVFLTDGRRGGSGLGMELVEIRKAEARRAGEVLGFQRIVFLDAEDSRLRYDPGVAARLRQTLESVRPDIVYLPFLVERHDDHRAANDVLLAAVDGTALQFECRGYEVSTPLFPNRFVVIDRTIDIKTRALACYESQLAIVDYLHAGVGLNAFRSAALAGSRYVEAFHALPLRDYRRLHRTLGR